MRNHVLFATALAIGLVTATAHAEVAGEAERAPPRRYLALELNPLGLAMGRFSATIEVLPIAHAAITLTPYLVKTWQENSGASRGVELGGRFYSSRNGPYGFFLGPSVLAQWGEDGIVFPEYRTRAFGAALDAGGQVRIADRLVVGAGLGAGYLLSGTFKQEVRVFPRLLLDLGVAF